MKIPSTFATFRSRFLFGFLACACLLGFVFYAQLHDGLDPCPLCIFQRVAFFALGLVFLIGGLHAPKLATGRRAYGILALLAAAIGTVIAGRHVWLTHLPPELVPSCGPPLSFMREMMPAIDVVRKVMTGSGECANIDWQFLGLSMPAWSLLWFVLLGGWAIVASFRRPEALRRLPL